MRPLIARLGLPEDLIRTADVRPGPLARRYPPQPARPESRIERDAQARETGGEEWPHELLNLQDEIAELKLMFGDPKAPMPQGIIKAASRPWTEETP